MPLHVSSTCANHQEDKIALHSLWYHHTYRCDEEHMCSKHVEAWNKLIVKQKCYASSWLITEINRLRCTVSKILKFYFIVLYSFLLYLCATFYICIFQVFFNYLVLFLSRFYFIAASLNGTRGVKFMMKSLNAITLYSTVSFLRTPAIVLEQDTSALLEQTAR